MPRALIAARDKPLARYKPEKGLQKIADAEKGERQCRRARDAEGLIKAVAVKIEEQAKYIVWRDAAMAAAKQGTHGGGPGRGKKVPAPLRVLLPKEDPGQDTADRWRKHFCSRENGTTKIDAKKLKLALEDAGRRAVRVVECQKITTIRGTEGTGEFERYTPARYVEAVRKALGAIDLDPATNPQAQRVVQAKQCFTEKDDGLVQEWHGRVFLNPPYHRELAPAFIDKLVEEIDAGHVKQAILLTNNSTDTDWFDVALCKAAASIFSSLMAKTCCRRRGKPSSILATTPSASKRFSTGSGHAFARANSTHHDYRSSIINHPPPTIDQGGRTKQRGTVGVNEMTKMTQDAGARI
jgi:hypothetical protein